MGFRLLGLEANFTECRAINNYVLNGKGDPREAIKGIYFWVWSTQEMLQVIEWMRNYNKDKTDKNKVKFYGFDMQFSQVAATSVAAHLKKLDSTYYNTHLRRIDGIKIAEMSIKKITKTQYDSLSNLFNSALNYVGKQRMQLLKLYGSDEVEYLQRDIRLLQQALDKYSFPENQQGYFYRDKYMAENVEWILQHEGENSKIMLWAHNGHIDKNYYSFPVRGKKIPHMGNYLKEQHKSQYYAIGFDFNKGGFRARDIDKPDQELTNFIIYDAETGSSGKVFSEMNMPAFFIDLENVTKIKSPAKDFFTKSIRHRSIGSAFTTDKKKEAAFYYEDTPLYADYDGLILSIKHQQL